MGEADGQLTRSAAEVYEEFFVPALFGEWAAKVADAARLAPGARVLDVACGTGALAREAARRVGPGVVTGVDLNEGMLAVARRAAPEIAWRAGPAEALPFEDRAFDVVVCQFGLMFFADRAAALREMRRVARERLVVAVWAAVQASPGYAAMADLVERLFGADCGDELRAPFLLGDPAALRRLFASAGMPAVELDTVDGTARYPSLASWIHTDVKGWTLADRLDDAQVAALERAAATALAEHVRPDGAVVFASPAHVVRVELGAAR